MSFTDGHAPLQYPPDCLAGHEILARSLCLTLSFHVLNYFYCSILVKTTYTFSKKHAKTRNGCRGAKGGFEAPWMV